MQCERNRQRVSKTRCLYRNSGKFKVLHGFLGTCLVMILSSVSLLLGVNHVPVELDSHLLNFRQSHLASNNLAELYQEISVY